MKTLFSLKTLSQYFIIISLLATNHLLFAQATQAEAEQILTQQKAIQALLPSCNSNSVEIWDESTEGGDAMAYYTEDGLKMIAVTWRYEAGKQLVEYYFDQGKLFFVFTKDFIYNRPVYWDKKQARLAKDGETFNPSQTKTEENRYYFKNQKLFLWTNNEQKVVKADITTNLTKGQALVDHAMSVKEKFKK